MKLKVEKNKTERQNSKAMSLKVQWKCNVEARFQIFLSKIISNYLKSQTTPQEISQIFAVVFLANKN